MRRIHPLFTQLLCLLPALLLTGCTLIEPSSNPTATAPPTVVDTDILRPLAGVELLLDTTLPAEPSTAAVFRLLASATPTIASVREMAVQFGLPGELYTELQPDFADTASGAEDDAPQSPLIYFAFSGSRLFFFSFYNDETRIEYVDRMLLINYERAFFLPFDRAADAAEAVLQEHKLLDFTYEIVPGSSSDVQFLRQINGHPVADQPEFTAYVDVTNLIWAISYFPLHNLAPLDEVPLLPVADAWQLVPQALDEQILYPTSPDQVHEGTTAAPGAEPPSLWHRTFEAGQQASLHGYLGAYQPAGSASRPRLRLEWFWIQGDDAELDVMAEHIQQFVHVWGTVREDQPGSWWLEMAGWETVAGPEPEFLALVGRTHMAGEQTQLHTNEGRILLLPDAPQDLGPGAQVKVYGPAIEQGDDAYPVLQWRRIETHTDEESVEPTIEPKVEDETASLSQVVITDVDLVYLYRAARDTHLTDQDGAPLNLALPAWRFAGLTNTGISIAIVVPAVTHDQVVTEQ